MTFDACAARLLNRLIPKGWSIFHIVFGPLIPQARGSSRPEFLALLTRKACKQEPDSTTPLRTPIRGSLHSKLLKSQRLTRTPADSLRYLLRNNSSPQVLSCAQAMHRAHLRAQIVHWHAMDFDVVQTRRRNACTKFSTGFASLTGARTKPSVEPIVTFQANQPQERRSMDNLLLSASLFKSRGIGSSSAIHIFA
jgi:hypothetical protein